MKNKLSLDRQKHMPTYRLSVIKKYFKNPTYIMALATSYEYSVFRYDGDSFTTFFFPYPNSN